ncbi:hypothetical protein BpHYR1_005842 [Brachionus plicatilis]|uniref:Uncharacterized protein n=1 Tax=Brachionus plicatilis TaxID=10195 RepID=A0A3M7SDS8_BRAPC|nr:hypothetical protein BpHYR1_005842 [Brachionus plicatilis]
MSPQLAFTVIINPEYSVSIAHAHLRFHLIVNFFHLIQTCTKVRKKVRRTLTCSKPSQDCGRNQTEKKYTLPPWQRELHKTPDFLHVQRFVRQPAVQLHLSIPCPPPIDNSFTASLTLNCLSNFMPNSTLHSFTKSKQFPANNTFKTPASHASS